MGLKFSVSPRDLTVGAGAAQKASFCRIAAEVENHGGRSKLLGSVSPASGPFHLLLPDWLSSVSAVQSCWSVQRAVRRRRGAGSLGGAAPALQPSWELEKDTDEATVEPCRPGYAGATVTGPRWDFGWV